MKLNSDLCATLVSANVNLKKLFPSLNCKQRANNCIVCLEGMLFLLINYFQLRNIMAFSSSHITLLLSLFVKACTLANKCIIVPLVAISFINSLLLHDGKHSCKIHGLFHFTFLSLQILLRFSIC